VSFVIDASAALAWCFDDEATAATRALLDRFENEHTLFPRTTGLPMTVWVSPRGNACHDVRVKVNMTHGDQMHIANTAVVGVRPSPQLIAGHLSPDDQRVVFEWISLNTAAIVEYWNGRIDTIELGQLLKRLP
jgi:hypothetical protein